MDRQSVAAGVAVTTSVRERRSRSAEAGTTLVEVMIAMLVLTVGAVGMASVFVYGMQSTTTSPNELLATQKAAEAIESVFSARDSHTISWAQLRNVNDGGIFINGPTDLTSTGEDGVVNTADDGDIETVELPGPDQNMATTADNITVTLTGFKREIQIAPVDNRQDLRLVTVIITYQAGTVQRTYTLRALISAWA